MKTLEKCEICGNSNFKFLFKQRDKNFNFPEEFLLYKCKNCGLIFLNPHLTFEELKKYYPSEKYYAFKEIIKKEKSKKVRLKLFLYDVYYNPQKNKYFLKILFLPIKFLVRGIKIVPNQKLLDIGCGSGQFLYEMKQFNMKIYGIEPGDFDKKTAKELNIKPDLIKAKYSNNFFDVITMNHVLQHVNNPSQILTEIHRILRKKGILIIGISNYRSLAYSLFKKNWLQLDVPRHLSNYSNKLLIKFLENKRFKIIKNRHNSRPNQFVDSLYFALNIKQRSGSCYNLLKIVFLPLTWIVNVLKKGDQVEIWCVKK